MALQRQPTTGGVTAPPGDQATWLSSLRAASTIAALEAAVATVVTELQAHIAARDRSVDAEALGEAAGQKLWELARAAADFANDSHFLPLQRIQAAITSGGGTTPPTGRARRQLRRMAEMFAFAARGASTVSFGRAPATGSVVRVLVTGFDPFVWSGSIPPETMNPSGAVALALDGTDFVVGTTTVVIEAVVLPVSFPQFGGGLVERIGRHALGQNVDAILTISLDESIPIGDPVRLERYVVGVHRGPAIPTSETPREPRRGARHDRVIVETPPSTLSQVQSDVAGSTGGQHATIGTNITFQLPNAADAARFITATGGSLDPNGGPNDVVVSDPARIADITTSMHEQRDRTWIRFSIGTERFRARVLSGPGGFFLSNEVSYRMLRMLRARPRGSRPVTSFHTHVPPLAPGSRVPASASGRTSAMQQRATLITTMQSIIRSVATQIVSQRGTP